MLEGASDNSGFVIPAKAGIVISIDRAPALFGVANYLGRHQRVIQPGVRAGQIADFTGISSPYEVPENPELVVNTGMTKLDACVRQVVGEIMQRGIIFHRARL